MAAKSLHFFGELDEVFYILVRSIIICAPSHLDEIRFVIVERLCNRVRECLTIQPALLARRIGDSGVERFLLLL
ncbi:hypothetical protein [Rhizobium azibense]|uniref:hypothetical protein n=1 Tax=Rhizobium azibense TaxID=1136135 RepID=UPI0014052639